MDLWKLLKKGALLIGTAVLAYLSFLVLFKQNHEVAQIILISILLHEIGHWAIFRMNGYTCSIFLVPFLGAAVLPDDRTILDKIKWSTKAIMILAGPFMNVLLVLAGLYLMRQEGWERIGAVTASINAGLAAVNLLPVFILDGGHFARALFASTDERHDKIIAWLLTILSLMFGLGMALSGHVSFFQLIIMFGFRHASYTDDPNEYKSPRAMTLTQAYTAIGVYVLMMFASWWWSVSLAAWPTFYPSS